MKVTAEQVEELAPDASSIKAGRKLAASRHWQGLGHSDVAVWGECKGSKLYQTKVDRADFTANCSCPSRKFPCKHALGLLFLVASAPDEVPHGATPEWVSDWLDRRQQRAAQATERKEKKAQKAADPVQQAKRAKKRQGNILAGIDQLDAWTEDLVRQGIARLEGEGQAAWEQQARRLVDAQAPGLAARVRATAEHIGAGDGWPARVLEGLGRLSLLTAAYRNIEGLPTPLQHDVRQVVGIPLPQEEVLAAGDRLRDHWLVLGQTSTDDAHVRVQRNWLLGAESGRYALILQFATGGAPFADSYASGIVLDAELAFWPSASPQRAMVVERFGVGETGAALARSESIQDLLRRAAAIWAAVPWLERVPTLVGSAVPRFADGGRAVLADGGGQALPLARADQRALFAVSGGNPLDVAAEWDGEQLHVLGMFDQGVFRSGGTRVDAA